MVIKNNLKTNINQNLANNKYHFSAYFEKLQMQLVLLIILEPTKVVFAETPESYVDVGGKNQRFAGRAGQHYLKEFGNQHTTPLLVLCNGLMAALQWC